MRTLGFSMLVFCAWSANAADLESRVLTHYIPQDLLETAVRTENWTEIPLNVAGGVRKGDTIRIWKTDRVIISRIWEHDGICAVTTIEQIESVEAF